MLSFLVPTAGVGLQRLSSRTHVEMTWRFQYKKRMRIPSQRSIGASPVLQPSSVSISSRSERDLSTVLSFLVPTAGVGLPSLSWRTHVDMTCLLRLGTSTGPRFVNLCVKNARVGVGSLVGLSVGWRGR